MIPFESLGDEFPSFGEFQHMLRDYEKESDSAMGQESEGATATPEQENETVPADYAAAASGSLADFKTAVTARREGKALPDVQQPAQREQDGKTTVTPPVLSKRQRDINERARMASERVAADITGRFQSKIDNLESELARLRGAHDARPEVQAEQRKKTLEDRAKFADDPNMPKVADFQNGDEPLTHEQFQRYQAAVADFVAEQRDKAAVEQEAKERAASDGPEELQPEIENFRKNVTAAGGQEFIAKLSPDVRSMSPTDDGARGIIARLIFRSPAGTAAALHFTQHPEALAALQEMPAHIAQEADGQKRIHAHIGHIVSQFEALTGTLTAAATKSQSQVARNGSPITSATKPPRTISSPGATADDDEFAAAARGDMTAFRHFRDARLGRL
jgi:hypothetical protein